jgi:hypothetical protein
MHKPSVPSSAARVSAALSLSLNRLGERTNIAVFLCAEEEEAARITTTDDLRVTTGDMNENTFVVRMIDDIIN